MEISQGRGSLGEGTRGSNHSRNFFEIPIYCPFWGTCTPPFGSSQEHLCSARSAGLRSNLVISR